MVARRHVKDNIQAQRPAGFTLIELLVVISILALCAGLLLPTLGQVRNRAQGVVCLANLGQLQLAFRLYTDNEEDGRIPSNLITWVKGRSISVPGSWVLGDARTDPDTANLRAGSLYPYVMSDCAYRCPGDQPALGVAERPRLCPRSRSYAMSMTLSAEWGFPSESAVRQPVQTYVFIDVTSESIDSGAFGLFDWTLNPDQPNTAHGWGSWGNLPADRHAGRGVVSYLDGHANEHRWRQLPKHGRPFADRYADAADVADATWLTERTPWYNDWLALNWPKR